MKREITKAVFPVAGMGSRFLPATKASPKEMLPVVDKPMIQYAVEEAVAAGMTEMIECDVSDEASVTHIAEVDDPTDLLMVVDEGVAEVQIAV